ncbi:hypothetical protein PHYBOEH_004587 [Phytophthora boehmeriae]|uniref:RxLR effector protein n=1 Tax=Phytophthora boehmeriae TaxID=109152 RepID=A0A8T1WNS2_9STRA|nr:hypothetical protein PHYBOEH_004587 [Phytophthora boehmeriae]
MRVSTVLLAITAATFLSSSNALSAVKDSKQAAVANVASDVIRSLETIDEPKRFLRSYHVMDDAADDDDDYDSLDSEDEERTFTFNKATFNKMLKDSAVANENYAAWFLHGMNGKAVRELLRVANNEKYEPLVKAFKAYRKAQQGRTG